MSFIVKFIQLYSLAETVKKATVEKRLQTSLEKSHLFEPNSGVKPHSALEWYGMVGSDVVAMNLSQYYCIHFYC